MYAVKSHTAGELLEQAGSAVSGTAGVRRSVRYANDGFIGGRLSMLAVKMVSLHLLGLL